MKNCIRIVFFLLTVSSIATQAQEMQTAVEKPVSIIDTIPVHDGFFPTLHYADVVPFPYPKVNSKNIRFYKRVWQDIDTKDVQNAVLAIPETSLIDAIMKAISEGELTAYSSEDDGFKTKITPKEGLESVRDSVLVPIFDDEGNQLESQKMLNEFNPERVTRYRIKEDIFFDKQRGRIERRIIGLAPLVQITTTYTNDSTEDLGVTPAFWLYFPQLRYVLARINVPNPDKGWFDMTMDDLFVQRKFATRVVREWKPGGTGKIENTANQLSGKELDKQLEAYKSQLWRNPTAIGEGQ